MATRSHDALTALHPDKLPTTQKLDLVRVYQVLFNRFGRPSAAKAEALASLFESWYPARSREMNVELSQVLAYLDDPRATPKMMALLANAATQEEQIEFARSLRVKKTGWTPELRKVYFTWLVKAAGFHGGNSFPNFMKNIKRDAVASLSDSEKADLKPIIDAKPQNSGPAVAASPRPHVKSWTLDELLPLVDSGLKDRDYDRGRKLFAEASASPATVSTTKAAARGPDLTGLAGRFTTRDLLESIVAPSKVISDQYGAGSSRRPRAASSRDGS